MSNKKEETKENEIEVAKPVSVKKPELSKEAKERQEKLQALVNRVHKDHGEGSMFYGKNAAPVKNLECISTGALNLDLTGGIGGLPRGRIVEIIGPEASGKSTLCLSVVAQAQKMGLACAYVDTEHSLDLQYARKLGVNTDDLLLSQPDNAEQALEILRTCAESGLVGVVVLDSVAALVPKSEIEGQIGDASMGVNARMMSQTMRIITGTLNRTKCLGLFINQIRMKIGVMFGSPETTTGGQALKFYSSQRIDVRRGDTIGTKEAPLGHMMKCKFIKNKVAPPFTTCEVPIIYGKGFDSAGILYSVAKDMGVIEGAVKTFYDGQLLGGKRDESVKHLASDEALFNRIDAHVRKVVNERRAQGLPILVQEEKEKDKEKESE